MLQLLLYTLGVSDLNFSNLLMSRFAITESKLRKPTVPEGRCGFTDSDSR